MSTGLTVNVLLVEDSPNDALLTREVIGRCRGFRLRHAERLAEAIEVRGEGFDVVLLGLGLSDSQGLDTLLTLLRELPDVPVVVMAARDDEELALRAVHVGAQDYLVKGQVTDDALNRAIRCAIQRGRGALTAGVALAFSRGGPLREVLHSCASSLARRVGGALARIWTLNRADDVLELQASAGLSTALDGTDRRVPLGAGRIGRIAEGTAPRTEALSHEGLTTFSGFPLRLQERVVGVLALYSRAALSETTFQALTAVADQIARCIERKRSDESLRQAERRFRALVEHSADAVSLHAADGTFLYSSPAAQRILGFTETEVVGQNPFPFIHPDDQQKARATLAELRRRPGEPVRMECQVSHKVGSWRWVEVTLINLLTAPSVQAVVGNWRDVTKRKRMEELMRQGQKMEAIGRLAGGVAHDFNNLLTTINGYCEVVLTHLPDNSPVRDAIAEIGQAGKRGAALTQQLLAFSRTQVMEPKVLDLNAVVTDTANMLRRLIGEDVELRPVLGPALRRVKADPGQIQQMLINLAVNARDAMPQGGKLTVETANADLGPADVKDCPDVRPGRYVLLTVTDTGAGMDEATRARVFEPFFTATGEGPGTGLGLATVYGIARQSDGHITVSSGRGRGTTFKVYLPAVEDVVPSAGSHPGLYPPARGKETILLAEDEPALKALVRRVLQMNGYTVLDAGDGETALRVAKEHAGAIDLLVTDVVMPGISGRDLAERLAPGRPGMKVLYISGYTDDSVVRHGVLKEEAAFLQKPFSPVVLSLKVREVLDRA